MRDVHNELRGTPASGEETSPQESFGCDAWALGSGSLLPLPLLPPYYYHCVKVQRAAISDTFY